MKEFLNEFGAGLSEINAGNCGLPVTDNAIGYRDCVGGAFRHPGNRWANHKFPERSESHGLCGVPVRLNQS